MTVDTITQSDLAYAAGLFDGEGCVNIYHCKARKNGPLHHVLRTTVAMTDRATIEWLRSKFGGPIHSTHHYPRHRELWVWALNAKKAGRFLQLIRPYLKTKATECWLALEYLAQRTLYRGGRQGGRGRLPAEELALREGYCLALREAKTP